MPDNPAPEFTSPSEPHTTRVKICGITNIADARAAAEAGADYLGYILHQKSARYISPPQIRTITNLLRLDYPNIQHIGVFVDISQDGVCRTIELAGLDAAQLHGSETADYCNDLHTRKIKHIKAMRFGAGAPPVQWSDFKSAEFFLCDTYDAKEAGGTGREFSRELLPHDLPRARTFLAGGLTPANIAEAIAEVQPYAVDVSSGVELSPGIKDHAKVREFIQHAKAATVHV